MHELYHVTNFKIVGDYVLRIEFDDGTTQEVDFKPVLAGELYGPLNDLELFNQVRLDEETDNLIWPNDADFEPADLHDWPEVKAEYKRWADKIRHSDPSPV